MRFHPLPLGGAQLVELDPIEDERGCNARTFCEREFEDHGLASRMVQTNIIRNRRRGTLRGMHWQVAPMQEAKLFRLTAGAVYDVIVDLREDSPTRHRWHAVELHAGDGRMLYVPPGFGQGFQTLEDNTELTYQVSAFHAPELGRGFRFDDPVFGIEWPLPVTAISNKDATWPPYGAAR